ncbi:MAG: DUF6457 domain-containing protein [Actinomycetota bacterium]|nr:DUF6457 domain-containing protein [Actinomycetota bacterium]
MTLQEWMRDLAGELGVEVDVDISTILDLARDAAHNVDRPAAPLTTFLVGYAAGMRGGSLTDVHDCTDVATDLTTRWEGSAP